MPRDGNDQIDIGPTVQKSSGLTAARAMTRQIEGGNSILVDRTEDDATLGGIRARNDLPPNAYTPWQRHLHRCHLRRPHHRQPRRCDHYGLLAAQAPDNNDRITLTTFLPADRLTMICSRRRTSVYSTRRRRAAGVTGVNSLSLRRLGAEPGTPYLLRIKSNHSRRRYDLQFDLDANIATTGTSPTCGARWIHPSRCHPWRTATTSSSAAPVRIHLRPGWQTSHFRRKDRLASDCSSRRGR